MEASVVAAGIGVTAAFACGACSAVLLARRFGRPSVTKGAAEGAFGARLARNGVALLRPTARALMRLRSVRKWADEAVEVLADRGVFAVNEAVLSAFAAVTAILCAAVSIGAGSLVAGAAVACCAVAGVIGWLATQRERRHERVHEAVPDALRCMSVCFQAGLSLSQTLDQTASELRGSLGALYQRAADRMRLGEPAARALETFRETAAADELAFVSVALAVQHEAGGSVVPLLDAARESVEGELDLRRSLRVQTAQAKLSARIVSVMPFVLIAVFSVVSEGFLAPFFASALGMALLAVALSMQAAGVLAVRRMLRIEVS